MGHSFGLHWLRHHPDDNVDFGHIERMQYKSAKVFEWMWNNRDFCNRLQAVLPREAPIIIRDHPLSEQKDDFVRDPAGTGRRHGEEWGRKIKEGQFHLPLERCYFEGINEPDSNHHFEAIDIYTTEFVVELARHGLKAAGWVFGVGHPSTVNRDPHLEVDWTHYRSSAAAIIEHDGIVDFHAYGSHNDYSWKNHMARWMSCPYPVTAILGEFGIDYGIVEHGNLKGWQAFMSPEEYVLWLDEAQKGIWERLIKGKSVVKLHSMQIYTYDFSQPWGTFDTRPVAGLLERHDWSMPQVAKPKPQAYVPVLTQPVTAVPLEERVKRIEDYLLSQGVKL